MRLLEKRKDFISNVMMMNSMTLLMIGSNLTGLSWRGGCFCTLFWCKAVISADFQADEKWPRANDRGKRVERGCEGAAVQDFWTHELMPSRPVAESESESRVERTFSTFLDGKDTESRSSCIHQGRMVTKIETLGHNILKQIQDWGIQPSHEQSSVMLFEEREVMEGEHAPETDFPR